MKRQLSWLLWSTLIVSFLSVSCKQKGSGKAYTLKMQLNKGDKFNQDMDVDMKMNFEIAGQKMDMNMKMDCGIAFNVKNDAPGAKEVDMTYTKMNTSTNTKGVTGAEGMGTSADSQKNEAMQKLIGKTITFTLNDKNEIISSAGVENVFWGDSTIDEASRKELEKMFSKDQMNSLFGMMFQMYPDKPVMVGEEWEKEVEVSVSGITMKSKMKYTLESVKDSIAYINIYGSLKGIGDMDINGTKMKMDMNGGQKGQVHIGLVNGYLKGGSYKMTVDGQMDVMGQKIPMKIEGDYFMKGN